MANKIKGQICKTIKYTYIPIKERCPRSQRSKGLLTLHAEIKLWDLKVRMLFWTLPTTVKSKMIEMNVQWKLREISHLSSVVKRK